MASKTTKSIPLMTFALVALSVGAKIVFNIDVDLETLIPILSIFAGGGVVYSAVKKASSIRQQIPQDIIDLLRNKIKN